MNLANKLTVFRILLVPIFITFLLIEVPYKFFASLLIFIIASFTDYLDGKIARNKNQITDFGKFADPLADKILVLSAFVCFIQLGITNAVVVILILTREFIVTSVRLVASVNGKVIPANTFGKIKTVSQIISIMYILTINQINQYIINIHFINITSNIGNLLIWLSVVFTILSGCIYIYQNKEIFASFK